MEEKTQQKIPKYCENVLFLVVSQLTTLVVLCACPLCLPEATATGHGPQHPGQLPDREEDRPGSVQRGVPGQIPAGQHLHGSEEGPGENGLPYIQIRLKYKNLFLLGDTESHLSRWVLLT